MKKMKLLLNNRGFTLVELMVVVAIIGILAAIAIPNYDKYQSKARQAEVKLGLVSIYTAESAFSAESGAFTLCLNSIGFGTEGGKKFYAFGFGTTAAYLATSGTNCTFGANESSFAATTGVKSAAATATQLTNYTVTSNTSFNAGGAGSISTSNAAYDTWMINEQKVLTNTIMGL